MYTLEDYKLDLEVEEFERAQKRKRSHSEKQES